MVLPVTAVERLERAAIGGFVEKSRRVDDQHVGGVLAGLNFLTRLRHRRAGAFAQIVEFEIGAKVIAFDETLAEQLAGVVAELRVEDCHSAFLPRGVDQLGFLRRQVRGKSGRAGQQRRDQR